LLDRYTIPFLQDSTHFLHGKAIFSIIDLVRAYQQIPVRESDIPKIAIIIFFGLFEFLYMTFGLRNTAQTFQRFMDQVTIGFDFCFTYIDDILIASQNETQNKEHLRVSFGQLQYYGIVINSYKCTDLFGQCSVNLLYF